MKLCGYKNGGDRKSESHYEILKLSLDQIAKKMPTWHIHRRILNNEQQYKYKH